MRASTPRAWQPLTFGGVARYGQDWIGRLFVTCLLISIVVAAVVVWTAHRTWRPVIEQAITRLPAGVELRGGKLQASAATRLAENTFLSIQIQPANAARSASTSDVDVTFAAYEIQFRSLFGRSSFPYRPEWTIVANSSQLEPWWGAWRPAVLGYIALGTLLNLFASWIGLGILNAIFVLILARLFNRAISAWGCWKLAVAALMPGALFQAVGLSLYALGTLRLVDLLAWFVAHFAVGWFFAIGAVFWLPRQSENPFDRVTSDSALESDDNPFAGKGTGADPPPHE